MKYLIMILFFFFFLHFFDVLFSVHFFRRTCFAWQTATRTTQIDVLLFLSGSQRLYITYPLCRFSCVLSAHLLQEIMMDHALRTISYIADIGDLVVLMARRRMITQDGEDSSNKIAKTPKMVCHVFESEEVTNALMTTDRF